MIHLYRRGKVWWARGTVSGRYARRSLDTANKETAALRARNLEEGLPTVPWPGFLSEFLAWLETHVKPRTRAKYRFVATRFGRFLAVKGLATLAAIGPETIAGYIEHRRQDRHPTRGTPIGPEGIKADLRVLRRMFSYALSVGHARQNPVQVPRLNTTGGHTQPFRQADVDVMLTDARVCRDPWLRAVLLMFLHTGLRIGDIVQFPKSGLDLTDDIILLRTEKRGKMVSIPLHHDLREALAAHRAVLNPRQAASGLLFPTRTGHPATSLDAYLARLFTRCGIAGGHPHRFRDTFAVRLLAKGASLYDVAKLLGITVKTAEVHYAPYSEELRARARVLLGELDFVSGTPTAQPASERNRASTKPFVTTD